MIRYVVFDYGNTLACYNETAISRQYVATDEEAKELAAVFFDRLYCDRLDEGTLSEEERAGAVKARLPEKYHSLIADMGRTWYRYLLPIPGMPELVDRLHKEGFGLYLLSNIPSEFENHVPHTPILRHFDGVVLSAPIGMVKPNADIYRYLLDTYHLPAEECIFVDDREDNILAARAVGMQAYLFDGDAAKLTEYIFANR